MFPKIMSLVQIQKLAFIQGTVAHLICTAVLEMGVSFNTGLDILWKMLWM